MGCIFKPFVYLSSGTDEMMNLCVYIQSTWENWMQLCRNLKVFSSAEQLCTPSLRHTQAQQFLTSSKGAECHFSMKNPKQLDSDTAYQHFFFFCQVEKTSEKRINSQHSLRFFISPYWFLLHAIQALTSSLICLLYGVFILYKHAGSQSILRADSIDRNCLGSGKFQQ